MGVEHRYQKYILAIEGGYRYIQFVGLSETYRLDFAGLELSTTIKILIEIQDKYPAEDLKVVTHQERDNGLRKNSSFDIFCNISKGHFR